MWNSTVLWTYFLKDKSEHGSLTPQPFLSSLDPYRRPKGGTNTLSKAVPTSCLLTTNVIAAHCFTISHHVSELYACHTPLLSVVVSYLALNFWAPKLHRESLSWKTKNTNQIKPNQTSGSFLSITSFLKHFCCILRPPSHSPLGYSFPLVGTVVTQHLVFLNPWPQTGTLSYTQIILGHTVDFREVIVGWVEGQTDLQTEAWTLIY